MAKISVLESDPVSISPQGCPELVSNFPVRLKSDERGFQFDLAGGSLPLEPFAPFNNGSDNLFIAALKMVVQFAWLAPPSSPGDTISGTTSSAISSACFINAFRWRTYSHD
jgi:hypothetical protein